MPNTLNRTEVRRLLDAFDFRSLFREELGWNSVPDRPLDLMAAGAAYRLRPVAEKAGVVVLHWQAPAGRAFPDRAARLKLYKEVARRHHEHLLIFSDAQQSVQEWVWVRNERGKPLAPRSAHWRRGAHNEDLLQKLKLLAVSLEEEEELTSAHMTAAQKKAFDVEKVTKKFYDEFKKEHAAFRKFVEGIPGDGHRDWYASLMLNRLMFVYFVQKKGFLAGDPDYLRNRLHRLRAEHGNGKFFSFYRHFLLKLFHDGLGAPERSPELENLLGRVPYLNGGLFDVHELERTYPNIDIADEAFERVFRFFDEWKWHLDDRPTRDDREINPDVLGYIFEKYINQKQMGAYYTKEDITEYIGKNTILPWLFDAAKEKCRVAFEPDGLVWRLLREDPDRYLYPAVKHGVVDDEGKEVPLPTEIAAGLTDVSRRDGWNRAAPPEFGLPTETWREHVARRTRTLELRKKLRDGEVREINDLVTYNLNIRQFAQDVLFHAEGPELVRAFWYALVGRTDEGGAKAHPPLSVLDPTCGSGAFLFAALNILEPLYDGCLERMQAFLDELDGSGTAHRPEKLADFRAVLQRVNDTKLHPNRRYFVLKSIILNNLFGVDIMAEAVEICKLRLFLKLVAQVERDTSRLNDGLEPLPDIDFNIRTGNTLVGFATLDEVRRAVRGTDQKELLLGDREAVLRRIEEDAESADRAFHLFQQMQTVHGSSAEEYHGAKQEVRRRLGKLEDELNRYLAKQRRIDPDKHPQRFEKWRERHAPFHWFVDFYRIMSEGGFDVVIGNPPYIGASKIDYQFTDAGDERFPDIYAHIVLRSLEVGAPTGRQGMIVPLSLTFAEGFGTLRETLCSRGALWVSSFDNIPAAVFEGVSQRCTISISAPAKTPELHLTPMYRWRASYRRHLTETMSYATADGHGVSAFGFPKIGSATQAAALELVRAATRRPPTRFLPGDRAGRARISFSPVARNFVSAFIEPPPVLDANTLREVMTSGAGSVRSTHAETAHAALAVLAGEAYLWYWLVRGDGFHVTSWVISDYLVALNAVDDGTYGYLVRLGRMLDALRNNALVFKKNAGKYVGNFNYRELFPLTRRADLLLLAGLGADRGTALHLLDYVQRVLSINESAGEKGIPSAVKALYPPVDEETAIDVSVLAEIDRALAKHYGFTDEELDFIINYDIKYRMGRDSIEAGEDAEEAA